MKTATNSALTALSGPVRDEPVISTAPPAYLPKTLEEAVRFAELLARSNLLPVSLRNRPGDVLVTLLAGAELGLAPLAAMRTITVIDGRPSVR